MAALAVAALCGSPAVAQRAVVMGGCDEASLKLGDEEIMKVPDDERRKMAMQEMAMAKEMMKKKDESACMKHVALSMCMMYVDKAMCVVR
ncbi:MAG: hypothetical protein ABWY78_10805 [Microvirga sp.]